MNKDIPQVVQEYDSNLDYYKKLRDAELQIIYLKDSLHAATTGDIYEHFDMIQQILAIKYNYLKSSAEALKEIKNVG